MTTMTIREKGYHTWDGHLQPSFFPWQPIFYNGIKAAFKKRFAKVVFFFCGFPFIFFLGMMYLASRPELKMLKEIARLMEINAKFFNTFLTNFFMSFILVFLGAFLGAELISGDIKFNAFPLYFSRPLERKNYIFGKFSILIFYFFLFTGVPGILLYIFKILFTGKFTLEFFTLLGLVTVPLVIALYISSLVLLLSSLSRSVRHVQIIIFILYVMSKLIGLILVEIFRNPYFHLISIDDIIKQLGTFIFNIAPNYRYPGWISLATILAFSLGVYLFLYHRIGKLEAQIESGN
jgi:ABC-2 type transport system permease protein